MVKAESTGIAVGLKKGYPVDKRKPVPRPSHFKGVRNVLRYFTYYG